MRALWKLFLMVSVASGIQWTISADVECLADAQLTARVLCARFMGGTGAEPALDREAHRQMLRRRQEYWATLPAAEQAEVQRYLAIHECCSLPDIDDYSGERSEPYLPDVQLSPS
jgi:hypothetical protein